MPAVNARNAISAIERHGALLVFPINNRAEPLSLWSHFYPTRKMRWEWDDSGSESVFQLWHLRERLSRSGKVVYAKWYQGRATFFSKRLFQAWLFSLHHGKPPYASLSRDARVILDRLEEDSPQSSKALKKALKQDDRLDSRRVERGLKELWELLFIVGHGEVEDGAFPSLAIGATSLLFDDLWNRGLTAKTAKCDSVYREVPIQETCFFQHLLRIRSKWKLDVPRKTSKKILTYEELKALAARPSRG